MIRNLEGQFIEAVAFDENGRFTGDAANISMELSIDDAALGDLDTPTPVEIGTTGIYQWPLLQAETDGYKLTFFPVSSTTGVDLLCLPSNVINTTAIELVDIPGAITFSILTTLSTVPVQGVTVSLFTEVELTNRIQLEISGVDGYVTMTAPAGVYYVQRQLAGASWAVQAITVS